MLALKRTLKSKQIEGALELQSLIFWCFYNLHIFSASNTFKLKANRRRSRVQVQDVKVYGNCCWKLVETNYRWEQDFTGGVESTINKYVYNGMKLEC